MTDIADIIPAARTLEGAGFEVRRPFPSKVLDALGPFILFDHMGPTLLAPGKALGAPAHPHAGLETLTLLLEGGGRHMDSLGNVSITGPGDIQWMRAGRGIVHDEGPTEDMLRKGGWMHGVQLWLNMPGEHKSDPPDYRRIRADSIPQIEEGGATLRLIAGTLGSQTGPLVTHSAPFLVHVQLKAGRSVSIPLEPLHAIGAYMLSGQIGIGSSKTGLRDGELARLKDGESRFACEALNDDAELLVLGGTVIDEPLVRYGPFVANSETQMAETFRSYQSGRFGQVSGT